MLDIDKKAVPYLLAGGALLTASTLTFFKGVSAFVYAVNTFNKEEITLKKRIKLIFNIFAWMGVSALTGYGFHQIQRSFFNVKRVQYNPAYIDSLNQDLSDFRELFTQFFREQNTLRNFCLSGLQTKIGVSALEQMTPSTFQIRQSPHAKVAQSTPRFLKQFEHEKAILSGELNQKESRCRTSFDQLQEDFKQHTLAKGVQVNLNTVCDSSFRYLASNLCSIYHEQKDLLRQYDDYRNRLDYYGDEVISERQFDRCTHFYNFTATFNEISRVSEIQALEESKEGILRRLFRRVFG